MTNATEEEKNDKTLSDKKQDGVEADVEPEDSGKKKKKKVVKEETKEKGNFIC